MGSRRARASAGEGEGEKKDWEEAGYSPSSLEKDVTFRPSKRYFPFCEGARGQ